jgi:2-octaprenyl-3-methyl-6-methoxy-1,4-benzoquinol hydroxylase/2-octaprenylphenol hydroxylase
MRSARSYVAGRVALVGDAAHVVHPLAGQGMNLGFRDVACLGRVLRDARERGSDVGAAYVLRRYERERRSENKLAARAFDTIERVFGSANPAAAAARGFALSVGGRLAPLREIMMAAASGRI